MIASLSGILASRAEGEVVIDVGGVGYLVQCSARTLEALPAPGERVSLAIETHVREDAIQLFGFADPAERAWFRRLQTVQGVGARLALGIVGSLGPAALARAIAAEDKRALSQASGVGPRLAARILAELKEVLPTELLVGAAAVAEGAPARGPAAEAVSALVHLGYRPSEAHGAVVAAARALGDGAALEELIRAGLKELAR